MGAVDTATNVAAADGLMRAVGRHRRRRIVDGEGERPDGDRAPVLV